MDSKEGIEQVAPVDARAVGLLDPSLLWSGKDDAVMAHLPREQAGDPVELDHQPHWVRTLGGNHVVCTSEY